MRRSRSVFSWLLVVCGSLLKQKVMVFLSGS